MGSPLGVLRVFVSTGCFGCDKAVELAQWVRTVKPPLSVEIIDLSSEPDAGLGVVIGVPTYVYGERPIFLGNPSQADIESWLDTLDSEV